MTENEARRMAVILHFDQSYRSLFKGPKVWTAKLGAGSEPGDKMRVTIFKASKVAKDSKHWLVHTWHQRGGGGIVALRQDGEIRSYGQMHNVDRLERTRGAQKQRNLQWYVELFADELKVDDMPFGVFGDFLQDKYESNLGLFRLGVYLSTEWLKQHKG